MTEAKRVYITDDPQLNMILQSISDRLDKIEGLRSNPKFYSTTFEFSDELTSGQVLTASGGEATFENVNIIGSVSDGDYISISLDGLVAVYAEGTKIHSFGG